ncbi:DUF4097 family beta strand repeat-containing protein [Paenibacillus sp. LHD-117]|uniref:DUF4097 family beta strand repeat-containing protein n=1 Tax=Paenibacillus sp. LHD-117 TaxID=3071412 RepID=UPI0027E04CEB|nr:DUF4097 family beta strand repeat-containing protein [Paenibacillus sp. LHD-117]MDQ6422120.1 DUF4097 family beta strand repeat-containing protein [Paenibacillus sp. LHD-117]
MKANKALGTLLVLLGVCALFYLFMNNGKTSLSGIFSGFTKPVYEQRTFATDRLLNVEIESNSLDVDVVRGIGDDIVVTLKGRATKAEADDLQLSAEEDGDTLKLSLQSNNGFHIGFNWSNVKLTVELPDQTWDSFSAELNSGDLSIDSAEFNNAELNTNSGDIKAESITALTNLKVVANSGDISLEEVTGKTVELENNSGDLTIDRYEADLIQFDIRSGDVSLEDGVAQLNGEAGSGDIRLNADDLEYNTDLKAGSGDIIINLSRDPESLAVQFSSGSGDCIVRKDGFVEQGKNGDSDANGSFGSGDLKLSARTSSGDIVLR